MQKPFHNFKITGEPNSTYRKVFLDGQELVGVRSCYIGYEVDNIPRAFIEIQTPNIEVEDYDIPVLFSQTKGEEECQEEETSSKSVETDSENCT